MPDDKVAVYKTAPIERPVSDSTVGGSEREGVRRELARILSGPPFRNSKRNSRLLQFLVERTLEGRTEDLKERTIGVEVFGRPPDYDTNTDHVVRSSCSEIRKRLAQYYIESGSDTGIRIDLNPGSYVPQFRPASEAVVAPTLTLRQLELPEAVTSFGGTGGRARNWLLLVAVFAAGVGLAGGVFWFRTWHSETALDRFWRPLVKQPGSILLCVGRDARIFGDPQPSPAALPGSGPNERARVAVPGDDAITLARLAAQLEKRGKEFRIFLGSSSVTMEDIRERSAVLIGAKSNAWTLQVLNSLRFRVETPAGGGSFIADTGNSGVQRAWAPIPDAMKGEFTRDYAIVARCVSPQTRKLVVIAAGVHAYGTLAAGDFLTNEDLMSQLEARAPKGWERRNLEVVLVTDVIRGVGGAPSVVASHFW